MAIGFAVSSSIGMTTTIGSAVRTAFPSFFIQEFMLVFSTPIKGEQAKRNSKSMMVLKVHCFKYGVPIVRK